MPRLNGLQRRRLRGAALAAALAALAGCRAPLPEPGGFAVTIRPLAMVLREIAGEGVRVSELLPPGASPHTYEPSARDAAIAAQSLALIYVDGTLDGWAAELEAPRRIRLMECLPAPARMPIAPCAHDRGHAADHDHPADDPHFWVCPAALEAALPGLIEALAAADPANAAAYRARGARFGEALHALDAEFKSLFSDCAGKVLAQAHPSWGYLVSRYGLENVAYVEPAPGREGSARYLEQVIAQVRSADAAVIVTEPQAVQRPAEVVSEATGVPLLELDPLATETAPGTGYAAWLRTQAQRLHARL